VWADTRLGRMIDSREKRMVKTLRLIKKGWRISG
jgi:hypothetical protein